MITDKNLKAHKSTFNALIGPQKGHLTGQDIIFAEENYIKKQLRLNNAFYMEAFEGIARLNTYKHYSDINDEHLFFNPIFTTTIEDEIHERTLTPFQHNDILGRIKTYGDLLAAETTITQRRLLAAVQRKKSLINYVRENVKCNLIMGLHDRKEYPFNSITPKIIYAELIHAQSTSHIYQEKWGLQQRSLGLIEWDKVWSTVQNQFFTEELKSSIWNQIHLNFYTTYNYNKWKKTLNPCPLCRKIPPNVFHVIFDCKFTKLLWIRIEKTLLRILPKPVTPYEKALGLQPSNKKEEIPLILRNWITFSVRHYILQEERKAYRRKSPPVAPHFFNYFNIKIQEELNMKKLLYDFQGLQSKFEKIVTTNNAISEIVDGEYKWKAIM